MDLKEIFDEISIGKIGINVYQITPELENLIITPTEQEQNFKSSKYGYDKVKVKAVDRNIDSNIKSSNIKNGIEILGVTGSVTELKGQEKQIIPKTTKQIIVPDTNYNAITKVTVDAVTSSIDSNIASNNIKQGIEILGVSGNVIELNGEERIVTPSREEQTITPSNNKNAITKISVLPIEAESLTVTPNKVTQTFNDELYDSVTVNSIPDEYIIPEGIINITENGSYDITDKKTANIDVEGIVPSGNIEITENGTYDVTDKASAIVNVAGSEIKYAPSYIQFRNFPGSNLDYETLNLDASNLDRLTQTFYSCTNLTSLKLNHLNTKKVGFLSQMCYGCTKLVSVDGLDASNVSIVANPFGNCTQLEELGALRQLGKAYPTTSSANYGNHTLTLSQSPSLTRQSLLKVINGLYDIKSKGCNAQQLVLGSTNKAKLSTQEIAIATNKGWTVS